MTKLANPHTVENQVAVDGTTAYVWCDPRGIGITVERAITAGAEGIRHVVVCGPRPGHGKSGAVAWSNLTGDWYHAVRPHVTRSSLRATLGRNGQQVRVSRVEPWFGVEPAPGDCAEAMRVLRHVAGKVGVRPAGTPGQTGRAMLGASWGDKAWPACPSEVAAILRATSGQGRFELFDQARQGGELIVGVDARFQYAALAQVELPVGDVTDMRGTEVSMMTEYAPSWCEVEFEPGRHKHARPHTAGLIGVNFAGRGWEWPTEGGPYVTWCAGSEVQAARAHGYRVHVRRALVWESRRRPLAPWARLIETERERIATLPLAPGVKSAARAGLRSMLVQAIGAMHGTVKDAASPVPYASAYGSGGAASAFDHPEWSVAIWALARVRLAQRLLEQTAPLVACALDGFYVAGEPVTPGDQGRAGQWREVWRGGPFGQLGTMADLYALKGAS